MSLELTVESHLNLPEVFDVLELMVESHLDLPSLGSVAIFVDAVEV